MKPVSVYTVAFKRRSFKDMVSVRYLLVIGWTACRIPCCVVTFNVSRAVLRPIRNFSDKDSGEMSQCRFLEVVFAMWIQSMNQHCDISPESLSEKLWISLNTARDTLKVTTQQGIRQAVHPITRRYRTDTMSLKLRRLKATVYTDTGFINRKSLSQNSLDSIHFEKEISD